jgi:hypothetical protein
MMVALSGYAAYLDASKDSAMMLVAGYVSTVEEWAQFEMAWKLTLAKFDVPYFHMKEFTAKQGPLTHPKWKSESYRAAFLSDLAQIIRGWTVASVCCGMRQELFDEYDKIYRLHERFNAYAICGRDCAAQVRRLVRNEVKSDLSIAYIFDQGDEGRGKLTKEMEASDLRLPVFKRSKPNPDLDKDDPFHVQLQACDFSAWELRRGDKDFETGKRCADFRTSLRVLAAVKHRIWKETKQPDLDGLIQVAKVEKR